MEVLMNEEARKGELQKAITEWRKKHRISDSDPLMAMLDLWQVLMTHSQATDPGQVFRRELESLTEISKAFSKQGSELISEIRSVPKIRSELWLFPYFTVFLSIVGALIVGFFIGRFLW
jgi:hypothetical protein